MRIFECLRKTIYTVWWIYKVMEITIQLSKLFDRDIVPVSLKVWIRNCSVRKLSSALFYEHLVGFLRGLWWVFLYLSLLRFPVRSLAVDHPWASETGWLDSCRPSEKLVRYLCNRADERSHRRPTKAVMIGILNFYNPKWKENMVSSW